MAELPSHQATTYSAGFTYVDQALKSRWRDFCTLQTEFEGFKPLPMQSFQAERDAEFTRLLLLNPNQEDLANYVDEQFAFKALPSTQLLTHFHDRIMTEYVTVAFLSHALSESLINAVLADGLSASSPELFSLLERADFKEKWLYGPKSFCPSYSFRKDSAIYETLNRLNRQRNSLIHYKTGITLGDKKIFDGTRVEIGPLQDHIRWIQRYFSLPYDLSRHIATHVPQCKIVHLFRAGPIRQVAVHKPT